VQAYSDKMHRELDQKVIWRQRMSRILVIALSVAIGGFLSGRGGALAQDDYGEDGARQDRDKVTLEYDFAEEPLEVTVGKEGDDAGGDDVHNDTESDFDCADYGTCAGDN
jgi:hypothetical protein